MLTEHGGDTMAVNIQDRASYLVSKYGGIRAASRETGIPYSTFRRMVNGEVETNKRNRAKLNRQFRAKAPATVKRREQRGLSAGVAQVNERQAKKLEASYRKQGFSVIVFAEQDYVDTSLGTPIRKTEYGRGSSVAIAKANLEANFERLFDRYGSANYAKIGAVKYRVLPKVVE